MRQDVCLRSIGREFQTFGPKTEKDLSPKVCKEKRGSTRREEFLERRDRVGT